MIGRTETIAEIGIAESGGLYVRPEATKFDHIYRAAMQIGWDAKERRLTSPAPKEASFPNWHSWTYADWLRQIRAAAKDEYGIVLIATSATNWGDMALALKAELLAALAES